MFLDHFSITKYKIQHTVNLPIFCYVHYIHWVTFHLNYILNLVLNKILNWTPKSRFRL